jgi:hypothetical protein
MRPSEVICLFLVWFSFSTDDSYIVSIRAFVEIMSSVLLVSNVAYKREKIRKRPDQFCMYPRVASSGEHSKSSRTFT